MGLTLSFPQVIVKIGEQSQKRQFAQRTAKLPTPSRHMPNHQNSSPAHARHYRWPSYPSCTVVLSTVDLGEVHLGNRVVSCSEWPEISKNCDISKAEDFKDDASQLMTYTINSVPDVETIRIQCQSRCAHGINCLDIIIILHTLIWIFVIGLK